MKKPRSPLSPRLFRVTAPCLLLLLGTLLICTPESWAGSAPGKQVKSHDITVAAASFLAERLGDRETVRSAEQCAADGTCTPNGEAALTDYAWRLLGFTGAYSATKDTHYLDLMRATLAQMKLRTDSELGTDPELLVPNSFDEIYSLHQAYEAYRATKDLSFLDYFLTGLKKQEVFFTVRPRAKGSGSPMLQATLARQYALAASLVQDAAALRVWNTELPLMTPEQRRAKYLKQAATLLQEAEEGVQGVRSPSGALQDECFVVWAKNAVASVSPSPRTTSDIAEFFRKHDFTHLPAKNTPFVSTQLALPCLHVLKERAASNPQESAEFVRFAERFILPQFDLPTAPVCLGSGGILSRTKSAAPGGTASISHPRCSNNVMSTGDAAWAAFLFSGTDRAFTL